MILVRHLLSFLVGSTVAMQCEDSEPWTHQVIKEANNSDHSRRSYRTRVTNTGRLLMWNTRHICSTPITREQYLWEQIKKGNGQLEDMFMETIPVEQCSLFKLRTVDTWIHRAHNDR